MAAECEPTTLILPRVLYSEAHAPRTIPVLAKRDGNVDISSNGIQRVFIRKKNGIQRHKKLREFCAVSSSLGGSKLRAMGQGCLFFKKKKKNWLMDVISSKVYV